MVFTTVTCPEFLSCRWSQCLRGFLTWLNSSPVQQLSYDLSIQTIKPTSHCCIMGWEGSKGENRVEKVGGGEADKVGKRVTEWKKTQERRLQLRIGKSRITSASRSEHTEVLSGEGWKQSTKAAREKGLHSKGCVTGAQLISSLSWKSWCCWYCNTNHKRPQKTH